MWVVEERVPEQPRTCASTMEKIRRSAEHFTIFLVANFYCSWFFVATGTKFFASGKHYGYYCHWFHKT